MCQLAAYVGKRPIAPLLLNALEHQEPYLGASATGMAALNNEKILLVKHRGHVAYVKKATRIQEIEGTCAIAHSRLAFSEEVNTDAKAHPFFSDDGRFALMHNGVIKNNRELFEFLRKKHTFSSYTPENDAFTDSEVAVHLLSDYVTSGMSVSEALKATASRLIGSFLLGVIDVQEPNTVYIANWHQPCYMAVGDDEAMFVSSRVGLKDVEDEMSNIFQPPKNSLMRLTPGKIQVSRLDPKRKMPSLSLNLRSMGDRFVEVSAEKGLKTFLQMWYELHPDGWAEGYGITAEEWEEYRNNGVHMVNPFIDVIEALKRDNRIVEYVDRRNELGIEETPRFTYKVNNS